MLPTMDQAKYGKSTTIARVNNLQSLKYLRKLAGAHKKKDYFLKYSSFFTNMLHIPDRSRAPARGDLGYSYATSKPPSNSQPTIQGSTKHGLPVFMNSKGELVPTKADSFQVPDFFSDGMPCLISNSTHLRLFLCSWIRRQACLEMAPCRRQRLRLLLSPRSEFHICLECLHRR